MTMNDAVDAEQTEKLLAPLRHELLHPIEDMQDENDRQFITALARGLELLRCFTPISLATFCPISFKTCEFL